MADGLNKVMLLGNIGADPELRVTTGGTAVLKIRMATSSSYLDKNKVRQERTDWHSVIVWGRRGEALSKLLAKGSKIFIEGRLQTSSYDGRDGQKRYKTEVIADNVILAGGRQGGGGTSSQGRSYDNPDAPLDDGPAGGGGGYSDNDYGGGDDNIPF